ncbi:hypothetical protein Tco_0168044 [Tanacetum coccineum]
MKELRLQGVVTQLNYSSEDVDEERELEAPLGYRSQPLRGTEEQGMEEHPESYDGLTEKVYSWLQAEEIASEEKPITFMDSSVGEKTLKRRPWEGSGKKNKERQDKKGKAKSTNTLIGEWVTTAVKAEPITDGKEESILTIGVTSSVRRPPPHKNARLWKTSRKSPVGRGELKNTSIGARDARFGRRKRAKEETQEQLRRNLPAGVTP